MRSLLLVLATVVLIVCGFVLYSMLGGSGGGASRRAEEQQRAAPTSIPLSEADSGATTRPLVGAGSGAWVRQFDEKTARLKSQFKADRYEPLPDGTTVNVEKPVAEFMLGGDGGQNGGGFIRIAGSRGNVIMPAAPIPEPGGRAQPAEPGPPKRGHLDDVVISLFERVVEGEPPVPSLVVTMNNASFDNDTFLIATEAFDDSVGNRVEADQVPVTVRGRDYDFDGRGLRIQWNSLSERLQLLEIAHGESLTVKNRGKFDALRGGGGGATPKPATSPTTAPAPRKRRTGPATTPSGAATPTTKPVTPYRASFEKDLVITEGNVEIASGSLMLVDFMLEPDKANEKAVDAKPNGDQAPRPKRGPTTEPTTAAVAADDAPATQLATTQPVEAAPLPIVVRWSGRMRVMPLEKSDDETLGPDDQVVRLSGTPLKLQRDGATIEAAGATFRTADGSASLRSSDEVPRVTLRNADGAVITTPALAYSEDGGSAMLTGPSSAEIPMGPATQREKLSASWNDECRLTLAENALGESVIRTALISGGVAIAHPHIDLNSDTLDLAFAAPTTRPAEGDAAKTETSVDLQKLIASGSVTAKLKDPATGAPPRSVQAQRLELQTEASAEGQLLPRKIIADTQVLLAEATQSMRAEHLEAMLAPKPPAAPEDEDPEDADSIAPATQPTSASSTQPANDMPELIVESIVAQGNVRLDGEKGAFATAEQLIADARDGQNEVKLQGVVTPAVVSDGKNTITGPLLKFRPKDQTAEVPGPGTLKFTPESKDGKTQSPVDVAWTGHAKLDGNTNLVELHEGVSFKTVDADGMTTTTDAQHLQIVLADKPTTQPTTDQVAATTKPTTRPSAGGLADLQDTGFLANKEPQSVKLTGDVKVSSTLLKEDDEVLRRLYMESPEANYDLASRKMIVPVPGRLLYEDHRPPDAKKDGEDDGPGNRGTTAFAWKKQLIYDEVAQQVTMEGEVDINHVPEAQGGEAFRVATHRVIAEIEPKPTTQPAATQSATTEPSVATQPATMPTGFDTAVRLKRVIADGVVNVKTRRFQFTATRLSFSPATGILTAHSAPGDPITLTDEQGQVDSAIESLMWNTRTDQVSIKGGRGRVRP